MKIDFVKKLSALLLCGAILASTAAIYGCAGDGNNDGGDTTPPDDTTMVDDTTADTETDTDVDIVYVESKYGYNMRGQLINPLTGEAGDETMLTKRPVAIMINNARPSMPQLGISQADVIYECMAEYGITRLMAVSTNYEELGAIGSVRSSREYYIDLAMNHNAIYIHAGGSTQAYAELKSRKINNIDGVNKAAPGMFYRDADRLATMASEHTLMTTGPQIADGIAYFKYSTVTDPEMENTFSFIGYDEKPYTPGDGEALHVIIPYNSNHFPQYIYDETTGLYARYQFKGDKHIDGTTGEQLTFNNIIIIACPHYNVNDAKGHIEVSTTGTGEGYYISNGAYRKITWSKATQDSPMVFFTSDGDELPMNVGKTIVNVVSPKVLGNTELNHSEAAE